MRNPEEVSPSALKRYAEQLRRQARLERQQQNEQMAELLLAEAELAEDRAVFLTMQNLW